MAKPTKRPAQPPQPRKATPARPRTRIETWSTPALLRLHALPRWAFPLFTAALLVGGLLVPNGMLAAALLTVLLLLLAWLISLSWPLLRPLPRLMRLAVIGGLVMVIVGRARGQL